TGTISITDNASGSPQTVSLSGSGVAAAPGATFAPTSLSFGNQIVGTSSAAQAVKLTNSGNATLHITSLVASGDYSQTNNCGASVAAGAHCTINVTFKPSTSGSRTGTLSVADNASGTPQVVSLTGTGMDFSLVVSPSGSTIAAGQSTTLDLKVMPLGGL